MDVIEKLKEVVDRFDPDQIPDNRLMLFRSEAVRALAFSIYHSRRNQRKEPWLDAREPGNHLRVMIWLKENPRHVRPI